MCYRVGCSTCQVFKHVVLDILSIIYGRNYFQRGWLSSKCLIFFFYVMIILGFSGPVKLTENSYFPMPVTNIIGRANNNKNVKITFVL